MVARISKLYSFAFYCITVVLFASALGAEAQQSNVFRNQYVIEPSLLAATSDPQGLARELGVQRLDTLASSGAMLVAPRGLAATSSAVDGDVVPYDPRDSFCVDLLKSHLVASCSPNFELKAYDLPNDPQVSGLWGLNASQGADAPAAWGTTQGSHDVVVAIIDTGVDYSHPDLAANIWSNPGEIAGNGIDDDHNGYVDDIHGINAITASGNPMDDNSHGSHVAGTIGAVGNNGVGVVGINWRVKIMGLKFLSASGSGSLSAAIKAIDYMVAMKNRGINIKVANNSWGGGGYSDALFNAIRRARDAGIIFTAAAGNEANDNDASPSYPATYELENVVSVAAIDSNRNVASFSNYGATSVDIAAPGVDILSTVPGNGYRKYSGTSMATPHVTGALALLFAAAPELTSAQAITRLYESGIELQTLEGMVRTMRMLNIGRLVNNHTAPLPPQSSPPLCQYSTATIGYAPDSSADNAAIVVQADENGFYNLSLPFQFPFAGENISSLFLSPNGVVYTKRAPTSMDYQNGATAPLNSIAALHTDLYAQVDPYGVRAYTDQTKAVIYWRVKHYTLRTGADVEIRLTLKADGTIEEFLSFGDDAAELVVQQRATIGLAGASALSSTTYAYNDEKITNHMAIRYTPLCTPGEEGASVASISVKGLGAGKTKKSLTPGRQFLVEMTGRGSGLVALYASLNSKSCNSAKVASISNGFGALTGTLPGRASQLRTLKFSVAGTRGSAPISAPARERARARKLSAHRFSSLCQKLMQSLK